MSTLGNGYHKERKSVYQFLQCQEVVPLAAHQECHRVSICRNTKSHMRIPRAIALNFFKGSSFLFKDCQLHFMDGANLPTGNLRAGDVSGVERLR